MSLDQFSYEATHTPSGERCAALAPECISARAQREAGPAIFTHYDHLLADAKARQRGENLDGSVRRETVVVDGPCGGEKYDRQPDTIIITLDASVLVAEIEALLKSTRAREAAAHDAGRATARKLMNCQTHKFSTDYVAMAVVQDALAAWRKA